MDQFLGEYYHLSETDFENLWKDSTFVFDTNFLLNIYRYPKSATEDTFKVLERLSNRIWIPYHVALEFQRRRLSIIADQMNMFSKVSDTITSAISNLNKNLDGMNLEKRHPSIDLSKFQKEIVNTADIFISDLQKMKENQQDVFDDDLLRKRLDHCFKNCVGNPPEDQKELDDIYKSGKERYENLFPPGFEDLHKLTKENKEPSTFLHRGLLYRREYGDLIIWEQLIKECLKKKWVNIIFISDDKKEDWLHYVESNGKKCVGPRPELIEEITRRTEVKMFHIYSSERFMELSKKYLDITINPGTISSIKEISNNNQSIIEQNHISHTSFDSIFNSWLHKKFPEDQIKRNLEGFPDFIRKSEKSSTVFGYEFIEISRKNLFLNNSFLKRKISHIQIEGTRAVKESKISYVNIFFVFWGHTKNDEIQALREIIQNNNFSQNDFRFFVGYIKHTEYEHGEIVDDFIPVLKM